jgi:hypothetical protein
MALFRYILTSDETATPDSADSALSLLAVVTGTRMWMTSRGLRVFEMDILI